MKAWLRQHRQAFGAGVRRVSWLNALVIGIALALPAGGYALLDSLRGVAAHVGADPQIALFLRPQAKRAEADALGERLRRDARLERVRFVPREEALKEMSAVQGMPELIGALGRNPLPDAFVVTPRAASAADIDPLAAELGKLPGVAHVQADAAWARRLAAIAAVLQLGLWVVAGLLGAALVAVTFNTIRLQILTQRAEIEVSKLIGATDGFIRRPFYYLGSLQGLAGGVIALGVVAAVLALVNREVGVLAASYGSNFRVSYLPMLDGLTVLVLAGLLGWLGAHLSVSRHLADIEPK